MALPSHELLLGLPLFQGMSLSDIDEIVTTLKLRTPVYAPGKTIVSEGEASTGLCFYLRGTIRTLTGADDRGYSVIETFAAPGVIQPERIFGLTQRYSITVTAATECTLLRIGKSDVLHLAGTYEIFRLNLLNMVCTQTQRLARQPWRTPQDDIRRKIATFISSRCLRPAGEKTVKIMMQRLADEICESRLNTSRALNAMDKEGLITLKRGTIHVKALEELIR